MKEIWNKRYSTKEYIYGKTPNLFFKNFIDNNIKYGNLLLPAEGEGRNAVYAAFKKWNVYAVDQSESAQMKALKLALDNKVKINYEVNDLILWKNKRKMDVVSCIFAHFGPETRELIHKKFIAALKPGGMLIMEAFSKKQLQFDSGGPKDYDWLYSAKILESDFKTLTIHSMQEKTTILEEGSLHYGEASIIRMIAQKPE